MVRGRADPRGGLQTHLIRFFVEKDAVYFRIFGEEGTHEEKLVVITSIRSEGKCKF